MSEGFTTGPTRNSLIRAADELLRANGFQWSPNKIINAVKRYERKGHGQTLKQFLIQEIARQMNTTRPEPARRSRDIIVIRKGRRAPSDPTGDEAVRRAESPVALEESMPEYITIRDAAQRYGISTTTLRRYITQNRITAHRVGPKLIRLEAAQVEKELFGKSPAA